MAAELALVDVTAQDSGPTAYNVSHDPILIGRQDMASGVCIPMSTKDVGDLDPRPTISLLRGRFAAAHGRLPEHGSFRGPDQVQWTFGSRHVFCAHLCVASGGAYGSVSEKDLNGADVGIRFEEVGRKRVPEYMRGDAFSQPHGLGRFFQRFSHAGVADRTSWILAREKPRLWRSCLLPVPPEEYKEPLAEHDVTIPTPLAVSHMNELSCAVDVGGLEGAGLVDTQAGAIGGHQHGPVLDGLHRHEELFDLGAAEDVRQGFGNLRIGDLDDPLRLFQ